MSTVSDELRACHVHAWVNHTLDRLRRVLVDSEELEQVAAMVEPPLRKEDFAPAPSAQSEGMEGAVRDAVARCFSNVKIADSSQLERHASALVALCEAQMDFVRLLPAQLMQSRAPTSTGVTSLDAFCAQTWCELEPVAVFLLRTYGDAVLEQLRTALGPAVPDGARDRILTKVLLRMLALTGPRSVTRLVYEVTREMTSKIKKTSDPDAPAAATAAGSGAETVAASDIRYLNIGFRRIGRGLERISVEAAALVDLSRADDRWASGETEIDRQVRVMFGDLPGYKAGEMALQRVTSSLQKVRQAILDRGDEQLRRSRDLAIAGRTPLQHLRATIMSKMDRLITLVYNSYAQRMLARLKKRIGDEAKAEEGVSDVFLSFSELLVGYLGLASFETMLVAATIGYQKNAYAKRSSALTRDVTATAQSVDSDPAFELPASLDSNPEHAYARMERAVAIICAFESLQPAMQQALLRHHIDGEAVEALAAEAELTSGGMGARLFRGREAFEKALKLHGINLKPRGGSQ